MDTPINTPVVGTPEALTQASDGRELKAVLFGYTSPTNLVKSKGLAKLCRSDIVYANVQVLKEGGENNLHAHTANDGIWMVLKGRAKFYGIDDVLLAELGPLQGIHIPRGFFYWFESSSDEMLELLQIEAIDKSVKSERLNAKPRKTEHAQQLN